MTEKNEIGRELWNEQAAARGGSLLQSWEWGALQEALGRKVARLAAPGFLASAIQFSLPLGKCYWYMPHGPVLLRQPAPETFRAIASALAPYCGNSSIFLKIEPALTDTPEHRALLRAAGWKRTADTQPSETLLIDLTKPEPELLRGMEHDTRYAIRAAGRRGIHVTIARTAEEKARAFPLFWDLFEGTNIRHELHAYEKHYYEEVAKLQGDPPAMPAHAGRAGCYTEIFTAELKDEPARTPQAGGVVASAIIAYFGKHAYYLYAASKTGMGKFNAPSLILWEAIRGAKQKWCTVFDLWGISETRREWKGVTAFKKSFGGKAVKTVGTWEFPLRPLWYWAYHVAKQLT